MAKTAISFYLDDTNPYVAPPEAFRQFLDFCAAEGVKGESSLILGIGAQEHGLLSRPSTAEQREFLAQVRRGRELGIDAHMEIMTHSGLFDFDSLSAPARAVHEGLWLHEPGIARDEYEAYFEHIVEEAARVEVVYAGVTWPGCGCEACEKRFAELKQAGSYRVNPEVWQALLRLAQRGRFSGPAVPCFTFSFDEETPKAMARDGKYGVWDLMPNAGDYLGSYSNSPERASVDYYIGDDGTTGRLVELVQAGAPHALFYAHWQGLNPAKGVGWEAFTQLVRRANRFLGDRVEWVRPSDLAARLQRG
jgi:hypothetical protein